MTDDLDTLRPEIREAVAAIDKGNGVFVNGDDCDGGIAWATARAELLRLQSTESRANEWQLRAERAEAELAALKARIADAPMGVTRVCPYVVCIDIEGDEPYLIAAGKNVRLVVED